MDHLGTVVFQLLKLAPGHVFDRLATTRREGLNQRVIGRWSPFVVLSLDQLAGRQSLPESRGNLAARAYRLPGSITWASRG